MGGYHNASKGVPLLVSDSYALLLTGFTTLSVAYTLYGLRRNFISFTGKRIWQQELQEAVLFDWRHNEWLMITTFVIAYSSATDVR